MSGLSLHSQAEQAGAHQPSAKQEEVKMLHPFIQLSALAMFGMMEPWQVCCLFLLQLLCFSQRHAKPQEPATLASG